MKTSPRPTVNPGHLDSARALHATTHSTRAWDHASARSQIRVLCSIPYRVLDRSTPVLRLLLSGIHPAQLVPFQFGARTFLVVSASTHIHPPPSTVRRPTVRLFR